VVLEERIDFSFDFQNREVLWLFGSVELIQLRESFKIFLEIVPSVDLSLLCLLWLGWSSCVLFIF
jgi:hypothetical protein